MTWQTRHEGWLGPRLWAHFVSPSPGRMLLLSPLLVVLTTWALFMLQAVMSHLEGHPLRPFDIGYLIPILLLTVLGGRGVGVLSLLLSAFASAYALSEPHFSLHVLHARDRAELLMLLLVGSVVVAAAGLFHTILRDLSEALATARLENRIHVALSDVDGVVRLQSCTIGRRGLDYQVSLKVKACADLPPSEATLLANRVETALRRLDPFIAEVDVTLTA